MSIQKVRTPMKKVLLTLATLTLSVLIGGDLTIYASDIESENNVIQIYEKNLETGEETRENIPVSTDENILNAESYRTETITPNIIIGEDESVQVPDILLSTMPYSAIGRVKATYYDGTSATGTGFLFGPNDVATAAHVLYNKNGSIAETVSFWLPGTGGPVATYTGTQLAIPSEFMDDRDINYDWGMFHINSNIGNTKGYLGWTTYISVDTTVQVIGYPSDQMMMAGKQVKSVTSTLIKYDVDTRPGNSGSPVLNRSLDDQIVAIHTGGSDSEQLNRGTRVTSRMASVLSTYRNE